MSYAFSLKVSFPILVLLSSVAWNTLGYAGKNGPAKDDDSFTSTTTTTSHRQIDVSESLIKTHRTVTALQEALRKQPSLSEEGTISSDIDASLSLLNRCLAKALQLQANPLTSISNVGGGYSRLCG